MEHRLHCLEGSCRTNSADPSTSVNNNNNHPTAYVSCKSCVRWEIQEAYKVVVPQIDPLDRWELREEVWKRALESIVVQDQRFKLETCQCLRNRSSESCIDPMPSPNPIQSNQSITVAKHDELQSIVQLSWSWMVLSAHAPERLDGMAPMRRLRGRLSEITLPFESHETPNHV